MMLEYAIWLAEDAKQYVDSRAWKEFAKTKVLDVDEDVEMGEPEYDGLVRPNLSSPGTLTLSPNHQRVRARARPQTHYLISIPILTATER